MKTDQQSSPLPWILFLLAVAFVDWIVVQWIVQKVGPQAIPIFLISFLFLFVAALLLSQGIQIKKRSSKLPATVPLVIKFGFLVSLIASICLFYNSIQIKELPKKYQDGIASLKSGEWGRAVLVFSEIQSITSDYKDTAKFLEKAKLSRAKDFYKKANTMLVKAKLHFSKNQYTISMDSISKAISLLEDAQDFNESARLLVNAKSLLTKVQTAKGIQLTPPLLAEISKFLRDHEEFGKPRATQSIPNWESGKRQRVTFNTGRNLLFYTKSGQVTAIFEDDPIEGRKKVWGEYEKYEKFTPVARAPSISLPAYTVLSSYKKTGGGKFGDIWVPSFSRNTPVKTREAVFRAIAAKEGINDVTFYTTEEAYKANISASFARTHPDAMQKGLLGILQGGVFTAGESRYP